METEIFAASKPGGDESPESGISFADSPQTRRGQHPLVNSICLLLNSIFIRSNAAPGQQQRDKQCRKKNECQACLTEVALESRQAASEEVAQQPEERCPCDPTRGIVGGELAIVHRPQSGEHRCPTSQQRDKSADEYGLPAVPFEEPLGSRQMLFVESKLPPVMQNERSSAFATDPIAGVVADNCAGGGRHNYESN